MIGIPFFHKKKEISEGYVFFLFLAGEQMYGVAMDAKGTETQSALYSETVDPFLKNAALKLDKILSSCEQDLGENIFLKKTVLFLNSLYVTESGAIREDYLQTVKKLLHDMELSNDGYVNFYDAVSQEYGKLHEHYFLLEESLYDYVLYEFNHEKLVKTTKVAKTQNLKIDTAELANACPPEALVFSFFINPPQNPIFAHEKNIGDKELGNLFSKLYIHNTKPPISPSTHFGHTGELAKTVVQAAPGFTVEELQVEGAVETSNPIVKEEPSAAVFKNEDFITEEENMSEQTLPQKKPKTRFSFPILKLPKKQYIAMVLLLIIILLSVGYLIFFHAADVFITTQKENFSTKTTFAIGPSSNFGTQFLSKFSVNISGSTTGQKSIGEIGKGDVTIYSGLFDQKTLAAGTILRTSAGVEFSLRSSVTIPPATTSGTLDSGGIVTKPGKVTVLLSASAIGPEGNISQNTKLYLNQYKDTDMYAVALKDFSGGYRRKVRVFSDKDATALEQKAISMVKKDIQDKFTANKSDNSIFFADTFTTSNVEKHFTEKVATETDSVSLTYAGDGSIMYVSKDALIQKVQHAKLQDKEFVQGTFMLSNLKLEKKDAGSFTYSATVNGKVQRFIDETQLVHSLTGKTINVAVKIVLQDHTIQQARIVTKPLPIPLVPWAASRIRFVFDN